MSTYESFGSSYDDESVDSNLISRNTNTQSVGPLQILKSVVGRLCLSRDFRQALILGQGLSLLLCGTGVFSGLLQEADFNFPLTQSFPLYLILGITFTTRLAYRQGDRNIVKILKRDGWKYVLLGIVDVEANYLVVKAYGYTSVTSVQILDCFSIATVLFLSRFLLGTKYRLSHYIGVIIALFGLGGLVAADALTGNNGEDEGVSNTAVGDLLVIAGALLYGISNVAQEFVVKTFDKSEFLGMIGLFSSFVSGVQIILLEGNDLTKVQLSSYKIILPWISFIIIMFLIYTCMAYVIEKTSATVTNVSILSADFYSLIFGIIIFHYKFHLLYFISFFVVIIGVAVYSYQKTQSVSELAAPINIEEDAEQQPSR